MTLREIYYDRGIDGLCDYLQPFVDQLIELTKPAEQPAPNAEAEAEEEGTENG